MVNYEVSEMVILITIWIEIERSFPKGEENKRKYFLAMGKIHTIFSPYSK